MSWYALHAKFHKEGQVADQLRRRRFDVFLPLVNLNPGSGDGRKRAAREQPFFPGYLFARGDLAGPAASALRWTPGLRGLVEFGGEPAVVSDQLINELRRGLAAIRAAGGLRLAELQPGDRVHITAGPLAGYEAVFDSRLSGTERVRVLLSILEPEGRRRRLVRQLPVELNVGSLQKVRLSRR